MMMKSFLAAGATAIMLAGTASAATVEFVLDAFVTSNFNTTTLTQDTEFVDAANPAGTLTLSYDTDDAVANFGGILFGFELNPTAFDLELTLGGVSQSWGQDDFLIASATTDSATGEVLQSLDFILLGSGPGAFDADADLIDITPTFSDFLRFDSAGVLTGVNLEIQTVSPIPLPASLPMLAGGALLLGAFRRKAKKA